MLILPIGFHYMQGVDGISNDKAAKWGDG